MKIALFGNPNCGKTTLFNNLTKQNGHVGNWPGVTVERKIGVCHFDKSIEVVDLPGTFSFQPASSDEQVTRDYIIKEKPDTVINIIDGTKLDNSLHLTLQLLEIAVHSVVIAINMADELKSRGITINADAIEKALNVPVFLISAKNSIGVSELVNACKSNTKIGSFRNSGLTEEEKITERQKFITKNINEFQYKNRKQNTDITAKTDKIVLNKWLAFPIFFAVIAIMYTLSIDLIGRIFQGIIETAFEWLADILNHWLAYIKTPDWLCALIISAFDGVGAVFSFLPQIAVLFFFISILESCGYMTRCGIIMDRIFRKFGLSGCSLIPMVVGCGCSVPAIMAARTIKDDKERKRTIWVTPFIPCSAKLPVFALIVTELFDGNGLIAASMYFLGIFTAVLCGFLLKFIGRQHDGSIFAMELPHYRMPTAGYIIHDIWHKIRGFIIRAGTIIVPSAIILSYLMKFNYRLEYVGEDVSLSLLATLGNMISYIFEPLGFGNWQSAVALLTGIFAKETVVSTFEIVLNGAELQTLFTTQSACAFMVWTLLSSPCIAAISAMRKELGGTREMWKAIIFQCSVAYIMAFIISSLF